MIKIVSTITKDKTTIGTLNRSVVQGNGTDSQENPMNNSNLNKCICSGRERNREIHSNQHRRKTERIWIREETKEKMG